MLANSLNKLSGGKRVLCLAPSKELTEQNIERYRAFGFECSAYSASIGKKPSPPGYFLPQKVRSKT